MSFWKEVPKELRIYLLKIRSSTRGYYALNKNKIMSKDMSYGEYYYTNLMGVYYKDSMLMAAKQFPYIKEGVEEIFRLLDEYYYRNGVYGKYYKEMFDLPKREA